MAKYRGTSNYIGAWHYVLLDILYAIPVIGWIILAVHCFKQDKESRMHYARSKFAHLLLGLIVLVISTTILYFTVGKKYFDHKEQLDEVWSRYQVVYERLNEQLSDEVQSIINQD